MKGTLMLNFVIFSNTFSTVLFVKMPVEVKLGFIRSQDINEAKEVV